MTRTIGYLVTVALALVLPEAALSQDVVTTGAESKLLPRPKLIAEITGTFSMGSACRICVEPRSSHRTWETAKVLVEDLAVLRLKAQVCENECRKGDIRLSVDKAPANVPKNLADQGYTLEVSEDGVDLVGWGEPGLYYGTRTLLQLLSGNKIPACKIEDWPDYRYRTVLYDFAREQTYNAAHMRGVIDRLSACKINMLTLYLETRFQFKKHPRLGPPGAITPEEARDLDIYAARRFVEIVPQINCLGHMEGALRLPEYRHLAANSEDPIYSGPKNMGVSGSIDPLNPETPAFIEDVIDEVSAAFKSRFFHIGGDEAWGLDKNPKLAQFIDEQGADRLFVEHYTKVYDMVTKRRKQVMMWGDMLLKHPKTMDALPKDIIIFDWHYDEVSVDTLNAFIGKGFQVFACPAVASWARAADHSAHTKNNVHTFIGLGAQAGAIGECTCAWEFTLGHIFDNDYYGLLLSADRSWNVVGCDLDDFDRRFCKAFFGLDDLRPVRFYHAVGDGFVDIQKDALGIWELWCTRVAFQPIDQLLPKFRDKVNDELYQSCLAYREQRLKDLDDLRRAVSRNRDCLRFADLPAHTSMFLLTQVYLQSTAERLIGEGKPAQAMAALRQLVDELDYFKSRFEAVSKARGGSKEDLNRIARIREQVAKRMAEIEGKD